MNNSDKIILDLAGGTGAWSKPYKEAGYDVRVITLPDYDITDFEFKFDKLWFFKTDNSSSFGILPEQIYGILAAPPCTYFSRARSNAKTPRDLKEGMRLVRVCINIIWAVQEVQGMPTLKFWALENPMGVLRRFLGRPKFTFDPCDFGDPWTKKTDIWGWFNEPKKKRVEPTEGSKMHLMAPSPDRVKRRSITPPGFAMAFFRANK